MNWRYPPRKRSLRARVNDAIALFVPVALVFAMAFGALVLAAQVYWELV